MNADPFAEMSGPRTIVPRVALGTLVLIAGLAIVGMVVTSLSLTSLLRSWDASFSETLAAHRSQRWIDVARWFSNTADTRPILVMLVAVTLVMAGLRRWRAMLFVPLGMLVEITTFLAVNYLVGRPRPDVEKIGSVPSTYSFPSGHVAATVVCWIGSGLLVLAFGHRRVAACVFVIGGVMTVWVGWARAYLGMHHLIDVLLGAVMGAAALAIAARALNLRFRGPVFGGLSSWGRAN